MAVSLAGFIELLPPALRTPALIALMFVCYGGAAVLQVTAVTLPARRLWAAHSQLLLLTFPTSFLLALLLRFGCCRCCCWCVATFVAVVNPTMAFLPG